MEKTTATLRKTFKFPTENDQNDLLPEALDEEEQENLIRDLHQENTERNSQFASIFVALPVIAIISYIPTITHPRASLLSILSISSLLYTTYLIYFLPPEVTNIAFIDGLHKHARTPALSRKLQGQGPVQLYLPYLNLALVTVLGLLGLVFKGREEVWWGFGWLPAGVYGVILVAKFLMGSVNPEAELETLRYEFKGA